MNDLKLPGGLELPPYTYTCTYTSNVHVRHVQRTRPLQLDEDSALVEDRHQTQEEQRVRDREGEGRVDGCEPGLVEVVEDVRLERDGLTCWTRHFDEVERTRGNAGQEKRGDRVGAEDDEGRRPAFVALDVDEPVA